jgi:hypothetical protein
MNQSIPHCWTCKLFVFWYDKQPCAKHSEVKFYTLYPELFCKNLFLKFELLGQNNIMILLIFNY